MSAIKLTADSGGGSVALKGPATTGSNGNRELIVPDTYSGNGSLVTADSSGNIDLAGTLDVTGAAVFDSTGTFAGAIKADAGIDFSGAQTNLAGMTSETLDAYEEGTFTPSLDVSGTSGSLSISYSNQVGRYVKVGRIVHFTIDIRLSSWSRGTGTGGILVTGLPFDPADSNNFSRASGFCNLYDWDYTLDDGDIPTWAVYQDAGYPWVSIGKHRKGNTSSDVSDPGNSSMMFFSGTYEAGA